MMLRAHKIIGVRRSVISCHEGQSWAPPALDGRIKYTAPTWAILISGFFMLLSVSFSMYLIFEHLSAYNNPEEQKFVLGVILMVPCYPVESVISRKQLLFLGWVALGASVLLLAYLMILLKYSCVCAGRSFIHVTGLETN